MDVKVTRNYSVYQNAVNSGRHAEKSVSVPASADKKVRGDAICISSDGAKKSEASSFAAALRKSMDEGAPADRIAALKPQVSEGTYQVSAEQIAKRLMSGL
jgi:negative regulator of flagellin synthesis FlgM